MPPACGPLGALVSQSGGLTARFPGRKFAPANWPAGVQMSAPAVTGAHSQAAELPTCDPNQ